MTEESKTGLEEPSAASGYPLGSCQPAYGVGKEAYQGGLKERECLAALIPVPVASGEL